MFCLTCIDQATVLLELFYDILVSILHVLADKICDRKNKFSRIVKRAHDFLASFNYTVGQADSVVILAKVRCLKQS